MIPINVLPLALMPYDIGEVNGHHASGSESQRELCDRDPSSAFQYGDFLSFSYPPLGTNGGVASCDPGTLSDIASTLQDDLAPYPEPEQAIFDVSLYNSILVQQDTGSDNAKLALQPFGLHQCPDCHKQFTAERLRTHRKPRASGQPPSCKVRYCCPAEQCGKDYADKPGLARHVRQCRHLNSDGGSAAGYQCRCGKSFSRWDKFLAHNNRSCGNFGEQQGQPRRYVCQCKEPFHSISSFLEHRKSEYKKVGRPKKAPPMRNYLSPTHPSRPSRSTRSFPADGGLRRRA